MTTTSVPTPNHTNRTRRIVGASALALLIGGSLIGCSSKTTPSKAETVGTTTIPVEATTTTVAASDVSDPGQSSGGGQTSGGGSSSGGSSSGGSSSGGSSSGGGQSSSPAPTITSFSTPENIDCHNGDLQNFTASWSTTNAVKVTISIDGPGIYDTYPANGSTSLPFSCSSSHTFLLTAYNESGATATTSVTLQPRNVQSPSSDEDQLPEDQP